MAGSIFRELFCQLSSHEESQHSLPGYQGTINKCQAAPNVNLSFYGVLNWYFLKYKILQYGWLM